ncbi:MAG: hypothetical protein LUH11_01400, partial [Candidatus Gastranaerophilales bacterium]|nr:hypothetical protein [Candidatus Gastranaerophilales bacterium]
MVKIFKKSFLILRNNLLFIQPFLLWMLMSMTVMSFMISKNLYIASKFALIFSMFLLLIAFSSGWFYINKLGVLNYKEEDSKEEITIKSVQNFKKFFEGIGSGFFKILFAYCIIILISAGVFFAASKLCLIVFGEPRIFYELPKLANASSQAEISNFINSITREDKLIFSSWIITFNITASIINFFCILYFTVNTFEKLNVFKSLWSSIKFFIKNIAGVISIILFMFLLYFILNLLSLLLGANALSFV